MSEDPALINTQERKSVPQSEAVDLDKERKAHEFRASKRVNSPEVRAALVVIRDDQSVWEQVEPKLSEQKALEAKTVLPGETHRIGSSLFSEIYRNSQAAAIYDVALYDATQNESIYFREKIKNGCNYTPTTVVGAGGVYGTIVSAAILKANPDSPAFGFDAGKRRGGIWSISGDVTLDKSWWRMNSRNRPEDRTKLPLPGSEGNLNSLGAEIQNLQVPDISSAQYPTNNELGRVLEHNNFSSNHLIANAELVKVRVNRSGRRGAFEQEYEDKITGERFVVYTDKIIQATGLGKEDVGVSDKFSSTKEALDEAQKDFVEGVKTPKILTFFQLVEATTSNRRELVEDFEKFGLIGKGDTSKVTREYFLGIGGIDPGAPVQRGAVKEVIVFGQENKTREELARSERPRYILGLLEFERNGGGFYRRVRPVEGRVVGVGLTADQKNLAVYYRRTDKTPDGVTTSVGVEVVPRLVTAAGFEDMSDRIYSGLNAEVIEDRNEISRRLEEALGKPGSVIYYKPDVSINLEGREISRLEVESVSVNGKVITVRAIDKQGRSYYSALIDRDNVLAASDMLINSGFINKLEIAGKAPEFRPLVDKDFDDEIPVAEKAEGFEIYKVGSCTNLPIIEKERRQTKAYERVGENSKSIFRFVRRTIAFAEKISKESNGPADSLNKQTYKPEVVTLPDSQEKLSVLEVNVDPKAAVQKLSPNLKPDMLLKYLALSRLNCRFPESIKDITFGVRKIEDDEGLKLTAQFDTAIPNTDEWRVIDRLLEDPLMQRLLLQLTGKVTELAEVSIGIKNGGIDIRRTKGKSVKNNEVGEFLDKYLRLKPN